MARSFAHGDYSHTRSRVRNRGGGRTAQDRARRELSQNLMTDPLAIKQVVEAAAPEADRPVLEPGAGDGALTLALAGRCRKVVAYELDLRLAGRLLSRTRDNPAVEVVRGDFLAARPPREPFAVVGNIPYAVTSPIVDWCLRAPALTSATLVVQLEYARKRTGDFGRWSRLTTASWPWFSWELRGRIDRRSFRPVPSVDSAVLRIERRARPLLPGTEPGDADAREFAEFVGLGFGGVGGSLAASLRTRYPAARVAAAFRAAGVDPDTVVAFVHPDAWPVLFRHLR